MEEASGPSIALGSSWVNDFGADFHDHESRRLQSIPAKVWNDHSAEEVADRSPLDETDGTYTDALPKASLPEVRHDRKYTPLRIVNMTVRSDKLDPKLPKSALTASTGKHGSAVEGVWPA
jgi:hypothetical protein